MKLISHQKVTMQHMNHHGSLEAEYLVSWMTNGAYMGVSQIRGRADQIVMCAISDVRFQNPVPLGAIMSINYELVKTGKSSLTIAVEARDMINPELIYGSCQVVFVNTDEHGKSAPHGIVMPEA